jgi:hypothetical protein
MEHWHLCIIHDITALGSAAIHEQGFARVRFSGMDMGT